MPRPPVARRAFQRADHRLPHRRRELALEILDDALHDGTYRITITFRAMGGEYIEIEVGEVDLAIPR
jgi:hypothetical protein